MSAACAAWREQWDVDGCVRYVLARGFTRVTLQFPDELQAHAADVAAALQAGCAAAGATVQAFVLADTTYQATAVDEVAALHVRAALGRPGSGLAHVEGPCGTVKRSHWYV